MENDPKELHNLYNESQYDEIKKELHRLLIKAQKEYQDNDPMEQEKELFKGDRRFIKRKPSVNKQP
jgi:hypothetical protein